MEGLVILLGSFLVVPSLAVIGLAVEAAVGLLSALLAAGSMGVRASRRRRNRNALLRGEPEVWAVDDTTGRVAGSLPRWARWLGWASIGLTAASVLALAIVQWFFLPELVGWLLRDAEQRTGIHVGAQEIDGNLFMGRVELRGVVVRRAEHPLSVFDLTADRAVVDLAILGSIGSTIHLDTVSVGGLRGTFERREHPDPDNPLRPRKAFEIRELVIEDAAITVTEPAREAAIEVTVETWRSAPYRSRWAAFDALFRTTATGTLAGQPFEVSSKEIGGGRQTRWAGTKLPLDIVSGFFGPPIDWIHKGTLTVDVRDQWTLEDAATVHMDWKVDFEGVGIDPDGIATSLVARPISGWLDQRQGNASLEFSLEVDRQQFEWGASPDLLALGSEVLGRQILTALGEKGVIDGFVDFLQRRRQGKD